MADRHRLNPFEMDPKLACVLVEYLALPGVEEDAPAAHANPEREPMFAQ
jgi:hypothetical protein